MTKLAVLAVIVLVIGCGNDGADEQPVVPRDRLQGTWATALSASCQYGLTFDVDAYEVVIACALDDGTVGQQDEAGTFVATKDTITTTARVATCPGVTSEPSGTRYRIDGGSTLVIIDPSGAIGLKRATPNASGVVRFGCYTDGVFAPSEAHPVP